jgi:hypothetical protein
MDHLWPVVSNPTIQIWDIMSGIGKVIETLGNQQSLAGI